MRETDYVELAFWAGWVEALGGSLNSSELSDMSQAMRDKVSDMVRDYLGYLQEQEIADACDDA